MTLEDESRKLGSAGPTVFPLALGCMGMSGMYGQTDDDESMATIHAALDHGITLLDTGDFYGTGHNEMLIGRALKDRRRQSPALCKVWRFAHSRRRMDRLRCTARFRQKLRGLQPDPPWSRPH